MKQITLFSRARVHLAVKSKVAIKIFGQMPNPLELQRESNPPPSRHATHEINEYKQNRLPLETSSTK